MLTFRRFSVSDNGVGMRHHNSGPRTRLEQELDDASNGLNGSTRRTREERQSPRAVEPSPHRLRRNFRLHRSAPRLAAPERAAVAPAAQPLARVPDYAWSTVEEKEATMLIVTCNGAPVRPSARMPLPIDSFVRATRMAQIDEDRRGPSSAPWNWEAIRREGATGSEVQAAEHDTAWQARRADCIYTILEIPDAITFSAH
jgi:hypothetical protein